MEAPTTSKAMDKPSPLYQIPGRVSEVDRTPRTYTTAEPRRDSYLTRPPPVRDTSSDARSWSQQTEDALDAYKRGKETYRIETDQTIRMGHGTPATQNVSNEKAYGLEEKIGVAVAEYSLDSGNTHVRFVETNQQSEKSAPSSYVTFLEEAELENDAEQKLGNAQSAPKNHRVTKMIVREDIDFFTALLEGHDPPAATAETETFVRDETETRRHSQETREQEAEKRRQEEAQAAKADTDFFMMLMQKG